HRRIRYRKPIQQGISVQRPYVGKSLFSSSNDLSLFWKHIDCKNSAFIGLCFTDERLLFYVYKPYFTVTQTNNENSLFFQWIEYIHRCWNSAQNTFEFSIRQIPFDDTFIISSCKNSCRIHPAGYRKNRILMACKR